MSEQNYVAGGSGRSIVDEPLVPPDGGSAVGSGHNVGDPADGDKRVEPGEGFAIEDALEDLELAREAIDTQARLVGEDASGEWLKLVDEATVEGLKPTEEVVDPDTEATNERALEHDDDAEAVTAAALATPPSNIPPEVLGANPGLVSDIDDLVRIYGSTRNALIPILEGLHDRHRQITDVAMQIVADRLGISAVDVEGVVTFYHFLGTAPMGQHAIHVCQTISCALRGMDQVVQRLERETGVSMGETTPDGLVTLEWANCIGLCDHAPAMLVDREAIGPVTPDKAAQVIAALRG